MGMVSDVICFLINVGSCEYLLLVFLNLKRCVKICIIKLLKILDGNEKLKMKLE